MEDRGDDGGHLRHPRNEGLAWQLACGPDIVDRIQRTHDGGRCADDLVWRRLLQVLLATCD